MQCRVKCNSLAKELAWTQQGEAEIHVASFQIIGFVGSDTGGWEPTLTPTGGLQLRGLASATQFVVGQEYILTIS